MKLNLLLNNPDDVRSGYVNVDPFAPDVEDPAGRLKGDVADLSHCCCDGEATEIVAYDILNYYSGESADVLIQNWLSCLAHGGKLTLSVVDLQEVSRGLLAGTLSLEDANHLLHGEQRADWEFRRCSLTMGRVVEMLENTGYKILHKRVTNHRAYVTCERP